jgi:hypothetical protein
VRLPDNDGSKLHASESCQERAISRRRMLRSIGALPPIWKLDHLGALEFILPEENEHRVELPLQLSEAMRQEIAELREISHDVVVVLREQADQNLEALRHRLASTLLRLQQRDPVTPLLH